MEGKMIMGLLLALSATVSQAQNNNRFIPPDWTPKTYSFALPELQIDSMFMENLNIFIDSIISKQKDSKSWRHFHIQFAKKDTLNYMIEVSLWDIPARNSAGFYEHNKYLYWFNVGTPPDIILGKKKKKQFSYKEPIPAPYDPPFWYLIYNKQTGKIEIKERYCFE
jgi:hypothetical protein